MNHIEYLYKNLGRYSRQLDVKLWEIELDNNTGECVATFLNDSGGSIEYIRKSWFDLKTFLNSVLD